MKRQLPQKGAEEARNNLPKLLDAAEQGQATVIARHGRPIAVLLPFDQYQPEKNPLSLAPLRGTGKGLWGSDSAATLEKLREEWER